MTGALQIVIDDGDDSDQILSRILIAPTTCSTKLLLTLYFIFYSYYFIYFIFILYFILFISRSVFYYRYSGAYASCFSEWVVYCTRFNVPPDT